jgi:hypothetical protein
MDENIDSGTARDKRHHSARAAIKLELPITRIGVISNPTNSWTNPFASAEIRLALSVWLDDVAP